MSDSPRVSPWALLNVLSDAIVVLDQQGSIRYRNNRWQIAHRSAEALAEGASFLAGLAALVQETDLDLSAVAAGLEAVLNGASSEYLVVYSSSAAGATRWFELTMLPFGLDHEPGVVIRQRDITSCRRLQHALEEIEERFRLMTETTGDTLYLLRYDSLHYDYLSPAMTRLTGYTPEEIHEISFASLIVKVEGVIDSKTPDLQALREIREADDYYADYLIRTKSGALKWIGDHSVPWRSREGQLIGSVGILTDISERKQREELIRTQTALLLELSTPLLPISDEIVVVPLIGTVDDARLRQLMDTLLREIAQKRARIAILDITGVPVVDTRIANGLLQTAQAVRLLGAEVILTGIRPEVAQALVGLGAGLDNIITHGTLQSGMAYALQRAKHQPAGALGSLRSSRRRSE